MPFKNSILQLMKHQVMVRPVIGNGWFLLGKTFVPKEAAMPEPFQVSIEDVLCDSGVAHAFISKCEVEIAGHCFCWIGFVPFTDSEVDLIVEDVNCIAIISPTIPNLEKASEHRKILHLETDAERFVHGSVQLSLR